MTYHLFLDDERLPVPGKPWIIVRNYKDFVETIRNFGLPEFISFDHDLGTDDTGLTCAHWLVNYHMDNGGRFPDYYVHSQNPVGKLNIEFLLKNYIEFISGE
jgi:hypothetical protein